jgi:hypothetical protein
LLPGDNSSFTSNSNQLLTLKLVTVREILYFFQIKIDFVSVINVPRVGNVCRHRYLPSVSFQRALCLKES